MAHIVFSSATLLGDVLTVSATVDGVPTMVTVWQSHLQTLPSIPLKVAYIAQQLKLQIPVTTAVPSLATATIDI